MGRATSGGKPQSKKKSGTKKVAARKPIVVPKPAKILPKQANSTDQIIDRGNLPDNLEPLTALTDKHIYFAKRYVLNGSNASKAARESGFNQWYGSVQLANDPLVMKEIERFRAQRAKKFEVTTDRIIAELVKVAFGTLGDFLRVTPDGTPIINCEDVGQEELAALAEITQDIYYEKVSADPDDAPEAVKKTKIKMHNKLQALEQLGRIFKMFGVEGLDSKDLTPEQRAAQIREFLQKAIQADGA